MVQLTETNYCPLDREKRLMGHTLQEPIKVPTAFNRPTDHFSHQHRLFQWPLSAQHSLGTDHLAVDTPTAIGTTLRWAMWRPNGR
jgi:hypothetical protein